MQIWDNPSNYKKCHKKQYTIHVCMPPKGTVVINKLEQYDAVKALGGREYFTVDTLKDLPQKNPQLFALVQQALSCGKAYLVTEQTPFVLAGTLGEMWTIAPQKLAQKYIFASDNSQINQQTLQNRLKDGCLDWTAVKSVPDNSVAWACFVPTKTKGQVATPWGAVLNINGVGVKHGLGDFVIAQDAMGKPNMQDRYVVNGDIFATTYNNQGWANCINNNIANISHSSNTLPNLVSVEGHAILGYLQRNLQEAGASKEVYDTIIKIVSTQGTSPAISSVPAELTLGQFNRILRHLVEMKRSNPTIKLSFSRIIDSYRTGSPDEYELSIDYDLTAFNTSFYGYAQLFKVAGQYNFATWVDGYDDPIENTCHTDNFNSSWFRNHLNFVRTNI